MHPTEDDDPVAVTVELQRRVEALLDGARTSYPGGAPAGAWWVPARLGGGAPSPEEADAFLRGLAQRWRTRPTADRDERAS